MDWSSFISGLIGAGFGTTGLGVLIKIYLDHRLNIDRDILAESRLARQKQREASIAVADILSEWVRSSYLGKPISGEDKWKLQSVYWKNILLLEKELIDLLQPCLAHSPSSVGTNELIVQARKVLLGLKTPDIKATDLNVWSPSSPNCDLSSSGKNSDSART